MMSPLLAYAVSVHELHLAFQEAGFTEDQALYLTGQRMVADVRQR